MEPAAGPKTIEGMLDRTGWLRDKDNLDEPSFCFIRVESVSAGFACVSGSLQHSIVQMILSDANSKLELIHAVTACLLSTDLHPAAQLKEELICRHITSDCTCEFTADAFLCVTFFYSSVRHRSSLTHPLPILTDTSMKTRHSIA